MEPASAQVVPSLPDSSAPPAAAQVEQEVEVEVGEEGVRQRGAQLPRARTSFTGDLAGKLGDIYVGLDLGADCGHQEEDDHAKMERVLDWANHRVQEVTSDAHDIDITHLPPSIKECLKEINTDGDNKVSLEELKAAAKAYADSKQHLLDAKKESAFLRKAVFGLIGVVILLCGMMFGMSLLAADVAKDTRVASASGLQAPSPGEPSSNTIMTSKDGMGVVATAQAKIPMSLSSTLGDNQLVHLTMASFSSDAGHILHVHVNGFLRVPMVGSRCGSVVFLLTQLGRIMLDDTDVSFEDDAAIEELNRMGFVIMQGGIGRRLQGSAAAAGFFNMLEGSEDSFSCGSIDPPELPTNYKATLVTYEVCDPAVPDSQQGDGKNLNCQSEFGGYRPGVIGFPDHLFRLTLPDTRRGDKLTAVDTTDLALMERTGRLAWKTEEIVIDSPSYSLTVGEPPHHFAQKQVSLQDKSSKLTYSFQVADPIAGFFSSGRKYCSNSTDDRASLDAHLEYRGLWVEGDKSYRHWRLMEKSKAEIAFNGSLDPSNVSSYLKENSYEYFDEPETLIPFRLISPDGAFVEYHNFQDASDEDVTEYLSQLDLTVEDALAPECELKPEVIEEAPRIFRTLELEVADAQVYKEKLAGLDRGSSLNSGVFSAYLKKVLDPLAAADYCMTACGIGRERIAHSNNTCALKQEDAECLLGGSGFYSCRWSNLAQTVRPCTNTATQNNSRRLDTGCDFWIQTPPIGNFGFSLCWQGREYKASGWASGCGWYGAVYICGTGSLAVDYPQNGGNVHGGFAISATVSVPKLASGTLGASIGFWGGNIKVSVSGSVTTTVYAGGMRATLRGTWVQNSGVRLTAEVDAYFGWSPWYRFNTYQLA